MKLFTKEIDKKLFQQYPYGSDLASQKVVAKIFNPYGRGTWYLLNSDPNDPDYIWAIVDLFEVEVGSVSRTELESIKVKPFGLGLERDLYFTPVNASELFQGLLSGKKYADGGISDVEVIEKNNEAYLNMPQVGKGSTMVKLEHGGNLDMLKNQAVQFKHHAEELHNVLKSNPDVHAWVVAKAERAATDLSDITHYLEGNKKMANGGQLAMFEQGGDILSEDTVSRVDDPAFADLSMYAKGGGVDERENNIIEILRDVSYPLTTKEYQILSKESGYKLGDIIYVHQKMNDDIQYDVNYAKGGSIENLYSKLITEYNKGGWEKIASFDRFLDVKKESALEKGNLELYNKLIDVQNMYEKDFYAKGGQIKNGSLVRVKKYGWIMRVDKIEGNMYYLENDRRGTMNGNAGSYLASDIELVMQEGGEVKVGLGQPVSYRGELYEVTQKDGVTHLTLNKEGAWGSDYPSIPLSMVDQNELRNIYGEKVFIPYTFDKYAKGGGVYLSERQKDTLYNSWVNSKNKLVDLTEDLKKAKSRNDKEDITEINKNIKRTKLYISSFEKTMNENDIEYAKGGKTTFKDKVASIKAKLLKNKKVPKAVQKDYGKTFSPAEAEDSAKRIAGAMRKKEMAKK